YISERVGAARAARGAAAARRAQPARIEPRRVRVARERDERAERAGWNMRVASPAGSRESRSLAFDRRPDSRTRFFRRFAGFGARRVDPEPEIEAIEER